MRMPCEKEEEMRAQREGRLLEWGNASVCNGRVTHAGSFARFLFAGVVVMRNFERVREDSHCHTRPLGSQVALESMPPP